jgi:hypothetical protein
MCSACFPRLSLPTDASLSSTGSSEASSPASTVLSRHYDFLTPIPTRFVSFAWWYLGCTRCIRSSADEYRRRGLELINPVTPTGILPRRRQDLSSSWRTQMSVCTCSSTPAGLLAPDLIRSSSVAHAMTKAKAPCDLTISELNSMAFGLAVYASQCRLPRPHARLASSRWSDATGRAFHPQGSDERFQSCFLTSSSSSPKLRLTQYRKTSAWSF